ncbi:alkaline phosphatase [Aeromicrobium sp. IC_218]|uniref:alkaline phosphatase n=1 Tax=Aeromicrobium sp. IC_218 TaxID=2545468 RepID=UPI00103E7B4A|nr:alkaline phosphatase [Aeromicrobium sp. IC_218]TCI96939.1 alkaline phosphatase [Aeromicrobium sp. IC_218]
MNLRTRSRRVTVAAAAGALVVGSSALAYAATDLSDHGGAQRNHGDRTKTIARALDGGKAENVILLIGDGMGDSEITSARNYEYGAAGRLPGIDALPLTGQYTTYSLGKDGKPDYVPDSAATGTAWATGTKSYDGAISVDVDGKPQATLLELAKKKGLRTGNVSTAEIQDATPAVQVAQVTSRRCYGPVATTAQCPTNALENGGEGSISEQLLDTRPDVTLGGGAATFSEVAAAGRWKGKTLQQQAVERGYRLVDDADSLAKVRTADQRQPLLGLFASGNLAQRWVGPKATADGGSQPAQRCTENPERTDAQPTLADLTDKAIDLLDEDGRKGKGKGHGKDAGFFLQVEGASIDKADHAANACGQIGELIDLDEAVQVALDYAKKDGNTTVIVTADHAHTSQIVEAGSTTPGYTVNLLTNEDRPMTINYATAEVEGSQQHTGSQLRIAGYGPQAANVVGLTDQTDLFFTVSRALGLSKSGRH